MTDRLDLDEMDVEGDDDPEANRGDWFWRGEGAPEDEPDEGWLDGALGDPDDAEAGGRIEGRDEADDGGDMVEGAGGTTDTDPIPGVPRSDRDRPVGVPVKGGGAGGAAATAATDDSRAEPETDADGAESGSNSGATQTEPAPNASGPHGGGTDDMTMALTYDAVQRLGDPRLALADANSWTDWIGIVGDVPAYQITKFQRDNGIDADFFSGAGTEPAERLANVDEQSMFYAERMVLVGVEDEAGIADRAGWEFVPLETAAEKADWDLTGPE